MFYLPTHKFMDECESLLVVWAPSSRTVDNDADLNMEMISGAPADFLGFANSRSRMHEQLPLVHSTRCEFLAEIAASNSLCPFPCDVFGEALVYLFYGRPAYRSKRGQLPNTGIDLCPICFILRTPQIAPQIERIFPFDTGAAHNGLFETTVSRNDFRKFSLGKDIESAQRLLSHFFSSSLDYFLGEPKRSADLPATAGDAALYYDLIAREGEQVFDDRRSAVELQSRCSLDLRGAVWAVVAPTALLRRNDVPNAVMNEWGGILKTYPTYKGCAPAEYYPVVREIVREFLIGGGFLR